MSAISTNQFDDAAAEATRLVVAVQRAASGTCDRLQGYLLVLSVQCDTQAIEAKGVSKARMIAAVKSAEAMSTWFRHDLLAGHAWETQAEYLVCVTEQLDRLVEVASAKAQSWSETTTLARLAATAHANVIKHEKYDDAHWLTQDRRDLHRAQHAALVTAHAGIKVCQSNNARSDSPGLAAAGAPAGARCRRSAARSDRVQQARQAGDRDRFDRRRVRGRLETPLQVRDACPTVQPSPP